MSQHIAVVGRGLIGSAAARHLATMGHQVTLIGPDEPAVKENHQGVFASHYDEGRITRIMDPDPFWARVAKASIERYGEIAATSGIDFFNPVGALVGGQEGSAYVEGLRAVAAKNPYAARELDAGQAARLFPYLSFSDSAVLFHEAKSAGHISPRRLVAAQCSAAARAGAAEVVADVTGIKAGHIETTEGVIKADQVLIAAGGFTNALLDDPIPMSVYARTIAFAEVGDIEELRLYRMPSVIYRHADAEGPYILPPIRYPDGKSYLKIGGEPVDVPLNSAKEIADWFRGGGNPEVGETLIDELQTILPDAEIIGTARGACVTSFMPNDLPFIERISPQISVATAGCGRGAKCSDELGRLGAMVAIGHGDKGLELT